MSVWYDKTAGRYRIRIRRGGSQVREILPRGVTRDQATARHAILVQEFFAQQKLGKQPDHCIADALNRLVDEELPGLRSAASIRSNIKALLPHIKGHPLDQVGAVAERYRTAHRASLTAATINRRLAVLRRAGNLALRRWRWLDRPIEIPTEPGETKRRVYLTRAQIARLVAACPDRQGKDWITLAAYTGMRRGELYALRPEDVHRGCIEVRDSKTGEPRLVPAIPRVLPALKRLPFTWGIFWLDKLFRRSANTAGMPHVRFHDLRHTTASLLVNEGVRMEVIGAILGHKDPRTTARYAHLSFETQARAMRKL